MSTDATPEVKPRMTIYDSFRAKFSGEDGAVFFEVPNGTSSHKTRSADAISVEFWASRGFAITGYEFKASRNDWKKELAEPAKADAFWKYCDFWYLVVTDLSIVKDGELPIGWGLMLHNGAGLSIKQKATKNKKPIIDRQFLCGICRAATKGEKRDYTNAIRRAEERARSEANASSAKTFEGLKEQLLAKTKKIQEFREGFGVDLDDWHFGHKNARHIGSLVRRALNKELDPDTNRMMQIRQVAKEILASTEKYEAAKYEG